MDAVIIIAVTIICCAIGYNLDKDFQKKYEQPGVDYLSLVLQCFFALAVMSTWPRPDVSGWFVLWIVCLIGSYAFGIYRCRKNAISIGSESDDVVKAIFAQCVLPIGVALVIIIVLALLVQQDNKRKRKR